MGLHAAFDRTVTDVKVQDTNRQSVLGITEAQDSVVERLEHRLLAIGGLPIEKPPGCTGDGDVAPLPHCLAECLPTS